MSTSEVPTGIGTPAAGAGYTLHVVAHSHWDREWYLPFQEHRHRLVAFFDALLEVLDSDQRFASFHLDGQTIMLDDYLEVRPERRPALERHAQAGRIVVGPWYVQPDEFLVSGEALVRNLLLGLRLSRPYGGGARLGYLPDAFGHIGQMPQILRRFEIDAAVFGRGLPVLREGGDGPQPAPFGSEIGWQAPDGSSVLGIVLTGWYNNAMELPTEPAAALARLRAIRDLAAPRAATRHLLLMNGMDHQPVQSDLADALAAPGAVLGPDAVVQDSLPAYVALLQGLLSDRSSLPTVVGELRGQATDGWGTLANTASARLYMKRLNHDAQLALERYAEPLAACAALIGSTYPCDLLRYAWKRLLQNHAHDSICGCSIDPVHEGMVPRFRDSLDVARLVAAEATASLAASIAPAFADATIAPLVIFNTLPFARGGLIDMEVDLARQPCGTYPGSVPAPQALTPLDVAGLRLYTPEGTPLPAAIADLGVVWDYALPPDRARESFWARRLRVRALVPEIAGLGYRALQLRPALAGGDAALSAVQAGPTWLENAALRVDIAANGSIAVLDKATGERYAGLNVYEDSGDIGDEYIFRAPAGDVPRSTAGGTSRCSLAEMTAGWAELRIEQTLTVPEHAEPPEPGRGERRSVELIDLRLETTVRLAAGGRAVEIALRVDNLAHDHRLRALFPAGLVASTCAADSAFDVVERPIDTWSGWANPTNTQVQQEFVDLSDGRRGLAIANRGLPEYEALRDEAGAASIALTLLRAVGHLGDWGIFPTLAAQCPGAWLAEYAIIPHRGGWEEVMQPVRAFTTPLRARQALPWSDSWYAPVPGAALPPTGSFLRIDGEGLVLSACKGAEDGAGLIVRLYNPTSTPRHATIATRAGIVEAHLATLEECPIVPIAPGDGGAIWVLIGAKAIVTVALTPRRA